MLSQSLPLIRAQAHFNYTPHANYEKAQN